MKNFFDRRVVIRYNEGEYYTYVEQRENIFDWDSLILISVRKTLKLATIFFEKEVNKLLILGWR